MLDSNDPVVVFYQKYLPHAKSEKTVLTGECPFCRQHGQENSGKVYVYLNKGGFFFGYFRCLNLCVPGGFPLWFAKHMGIDPQEVPGFDPDREAFSQFVDFPVQNCNQEMTNFQDRLTSHLYNQFLKGGVKEPVLEQMHVGYNGRYLTYPYIQSDGNCYSMRCVHPEKREDFFWHGDENFFKEKYQIFNVQDIERCENGSLFICEGEDNLLALKQLGFPAIAVPDSNVLESIDPNQLAFVDNIFMVINNNPESEAAARMVASRIGYKVRILKWPAGLSKDYNLWQLAQDKKNDFQNAVLALLKSSKSFSPFSSPKREGDRFFERLALETGEEYASLRSGFTKMDQALGGIHGINIIGGPPKVGKSCFIIQVATEMASRGVPVLYYDFENGRQKIYLRTLSRKSALTTQKLRTKNFGEEEGGRYDEARKNLKQLLYHFRVINDRQVSPEIMRRHVDFIRHETRSEFTVVVIDSLHKLPFKDFTERRTGIDAWLRQMESIRDDLQVSFLVISELSRGEKGSYHGEPHMGLFKGSGDIEYSADNAMILTPGWNAMEKLQGSERKNKLWLVGSREHSPGLIGEYALDYPYWGFKEL